LIGAIGTVKHSIYESPFDPYEYPIRTFQARVIALLETTFGIRYERAIKLSQVSLLDAVKNLSRG
jgi:hypothetical protein